MKVEILDTGEARILVESNVYSLDVMHKCLYWYGEKLDTDISVIEGNQIELFIQTKNGASIESIIPKLKADIIDFKTRDIITKETQNIRDLLVAKAFSNGEFDEKPSGDIEDPVGFDPKSFH